MHSSTEVTGSRWLSSVMDLDGVKCLNESEDGSGKAVLKSYSKRVEPLPTVSSLDGAELLFFIPFTESVKIRSVCLVGGRSIERISLWVNRSDIDFDNANSVKPTCLITNLIPDFDGSIDYALNAKFSNIISLVCLLRGSGDELALSCLGFKGEWTGHKGGVVDTTFELRASVKDHTKVDSDFNATFSTPPS